METLNIREVLYAEGLPIGASCLETPLDSWVFGRRLCRPPDSGEFQAAFAGWLWIVDKPLAASAAGAVLHYLRETQKSAMGHLNRPGVLRADRTTWFWMRRRFAILNW